MEKNKDQGDLRDDLERLEEKAKNLSKKLGTSAEQAGYIVDAVGSVTKSYRGVMDLQTDEAGISQAVESGKKIVSGLEDFLDPLLNSADSLNKILDSGMPVFSTASSASVTMGNSFSIFPSPARFIPCPFLPKSETERYTNKLEQLDPSIAKTYKSAWSLYYAESHDPGRPALWQLRQAIDHFFDLLAPTQQVRESPCWSPKPTGDSQAVHRKERLQFAAANRVKDTRQRAVLIESTDEMLRALERLSAAHKRGPIDHQRAREVFLSADDVLRRWIDAISVSAPS